MKILFSGLFVWIICINSLEAQNDIYAISIDSLWNMQVSGGSRYSQSVEKMPNTILVINEKQIESRGYRDLSDVLQDLPGIDFSDLASRYGEYVTMRGIQGNERILVLIDGHKLNPPTGTMLSIGNSISVQFVKQIEIIYGPASVMYGSDAFAGIINIISKDPTKSKIDFRFNSSYASLNSVDVMAETQFNLNKDLSLSVLGRVYKSEGLDLVGTDPMFDFIKQYPAPFNTFCDQPINDYTLFFKGNYKKISAGYLRQGFNEGNAYSQNPASNIYSSMNRWKSSTDNAWLSYKNNVGKLGLLTVDFNLINYKIDDTTQYTKWVTPNTPTEYFSQFMTGSDLALKTSVNLFSVPSKQLKFISGIDYELIQSIPPYANDQLFGKSLQFVGETAKTIKNKLTLVEHRISAFTQMVWTPYSFLDIAAGGRIDYSSRFKAAFNPQLGFTLQPISSMLVKFMYSSASQAPSLFFMYEQWGSGTHVMLSVDEVKSLIDPNWQLKNQLVSTYEVSIVQKIGELFQFKSGLYNNNLTNLIERITFDNVGITFNKYKTDNIFTKGIRNENIGSQQTTGFFSELNFSYKNKLESYIYYNYTNSTSVNSRSEIATPRVSMHKLHLGATYFNAFNLFNISARFRYIGDINNLNTVVFPSGKQPGYTMLDLTLTTNSIYKVAKAFVQINNVLNQTVEHAGLFQQVSGYLPTIRQEPIRVKLGLEIRLKK